MSKNRNFLETLIETIPNAIFYKDSNLIYKFCNNAYLEFLGRTKSEVIGHRAEDISPKELAEIYTKADENLIKSKTTQIYESKVKYNDGTEHNVIFNKATVVNNEGSVIGIVGVIIDITERVKAEEKIIYLSRHDSLTGLFNRGYFEEIFSKSLNESIENNREFFLVVIDLNQLKKVNDTFGHLAGDVYITRFSNQLKQLLDSENIVARIGGDEFAIVTFDISLQQLTEKLENLQMFLYRHTANFQTNGIVWGFSYGISAFPGDGEDYNSLMRLADERMYTYKKNYKIQINNLNNAPDVQNPT